MKTKFEFENFEIEIEFSNISENESINLAISNLETELEINDFIDYNNFSEILNTINEDFTIRYISHKVI